MKGLNVVGSHLLGERREGEGGGREGTRWGKEGGGVQAFRPVPNSHFSLLFDRGLLKEANLFLANGRRYGLVGRNGAGKSTLLRVMAK